MMTLFHIALTDKRLEKDKEVKLKDISFQLMLSFKNIFSRYKKQWKTEYHMILLNICSGNFLQK